MSTRRLFLALLPDAAIRDALARLAVEAGVVRGAGLRAVPARRYHATLLFLGNYAEAQPALEAAVRQLAAHQPGAAVDWTLEVLRSFPGRQAPRVLCGSVLPEALRQLWRDWREALPRSLPQLALEDRFVPHVTLGYGRARLPVQAVAPLHWRVGELALFESRPAWPDYGVLARWPLSPP